MGGELMALELFAGFDVSALSVGTAFSMTIKRNGESNATVGATAIADESVDNTSLFLHEHSIETAMNLNLHHNQPDLSSADKCPYDGIYSDLSFRSALQDAMTHAVGGWAGPPMFSVGWSSGRYTIQISDSATWGMSFANTSTELLLGFTTAVTGTTIYTSVADVNFYLAGTLSEVSEVKDVYESGGQASVALADNGFPQEALSRTQGIQQLDFTLQFEPKRKTYIQARTTEIPFPFEVLFAHCRCEYPILVDGAHWTDADGYGLNYGAPVVLLREDGAAFDPVRAHPTYDDYWHIPFRTYLVAWGT